MHPVNPSDYSAFICAANNSRCGTVYPLSIAEGFQRGDIFTASEDNACAVLFWAHCGFAYLSGHSDGKFLESIYSVMTSGRPRRLHLMTADDEVVSFFQDKKRIAVENRFLFDYHGTDIPPDLSLSPAFKIKEIDLSLLRRISGSIIPSLFWKDDENFLENGKGYCIICGDDIAAWAFSAAISSTEVDIGIETSPGYKRRGLGAVAAQAMIDYVTAQGKKPLWACHFKNTASEKMAEKLGIVKSSVITVIRPD